MDRGSQYRSRLLPRQAPSITQPTPSASSNSQQTDSLVTLRPTGSVTTPSAPTGRADSSDASGTQDATGQDGSTDKTGDSTSKPPSQPPSSDTTTDTTTKPTQDTTQPPSSATTASQTSKPTPKPPASDTTSPSTTVQSTTDTTTQSHTIDSTTSATTDTTSDTTSARTHITPSPTSSTITPPPTSSTNPLSDLVSTSTNPSSGSFETTITSAIATTVIDGKTSTVFTAIPTTLSSSDSGDDVSATKRNIIAGTVGGAGFIILVAAIFLFYRRHQHKKLSFFKRLQPKPRTRLLDGEDMEDYDLDPPTRYRDYPASVVSSHAHSRSVTNTTPIPGRSPMSRSFAASPGPSLMGSSMDPHRTATPTGSSTALPAGAAVPHVLGMRAETGSIFREAVWPPPGEPSALVDPLRAASAVDLTRIIDDVMGPSGSSSGPGSTSGHSHTGSPPSAFRGGHGLGASASGSTSSLVGDDPFASFSTLVPTPIHSRETSDAPLLPKSKLGSSASASTPGFFDYTPVAPVPPVPQRSHLRESQISQAPGSPMPAPGMGKLFVTNMGPLSPTSTVSPVSPPPETTFAAQQALGQTSPTQGQPKNWLERSPKKLSREVGGRSSVDQTEEVSPVDVTDLTSDGHGVGRAM